MLSIIIILASFVSMEFFAYYSHKYIMHGIGWTWHESHHKPSAQGGFEKNDLFVLYFALIAISLFAGGRFLSPILTFIAIGISLYGLAYTLFHDGLVHQRYFFKYTPKRGYLKHIIHAHRLHHKTLTQHGAVSFGFLWAGNIEHLKTELIQNQKDRL